MITQTFQRDAAVGESVNVWLVYITLTNALLDYKCLEEVEVYSVRCIGEKHENVYF